MAIKVGDAAPDFTLQSQAGESVTLSDFQGQKVVVLYFYPKDDTPGCTTESCTFRDRFQDFQDLGVEVIGISSDSTDSHQKFASKYSLPFTLVSDTLESVSLTRVYSLPFTLVSDTDSSVRRAYGVPATLGLLPGRVTYVIDKTGTVRHLFNSQFNPKKHVDEALSVLKGLG